MNTQRTSQTYRRRPKLYYGVSARLWSGALAAAIILGSLVYCLLTHRIPI